jgi:hypothetical protein
MGLVSNSMQSMGHIGQGGSIAILLYGMAMALFVLWIVFRET